MELDDYRGFWQERLNFRPRKSASAGEISSLRADQGVAVLPLAYEAFLLVAGRGYGDLWVGTDAFFPQLMGLRNDAEGLLVENGIESFLRPDDVVIAMHQGYQFTYLSGPGEDPPVFLYVEGGGAVRQLAESFTSWILELVSD